MHFKDNLVLFVGALCLFYGITLSQSAGKRNAPLSRFTCGGRASGYYADVETGCQVYHMCDGLGRQFTYTCPNTTLFQQRMLICDHWYMVNCSRSESDYDANLLIGQRDKPFVSDEEMRLRTPRPDILSVPPNSNYYDGLKEAESKYPVHPDNNIVGIGDSLSNSQNNGLDSAKQQYRPPTSWSTGTGSKNNYGTRPNNRPNGNSNTNFFNEHNNNHQSSDNSQINSEASTNNGVFGGNSHGSGSTKGNRFPSSSIRPEPDNLTGAASQGTLPTFQPLPTNTHPNHRPSRVTPPSQDLSPPFPPTTTDSPVEFNLDVRMMNSHEDPVYDFIKRFDPNAPDSHKTSMSTSEILNINSQLPSGHEASSEEERTPRRNKNDASNFNTLQTEDKGVTEATRFNTINQKPSTLPDDNQSAANGIKIPERVLLPPKKEISEIPSTTMGPPVYYEWKWAVPAFDLEPPKESNATNNRTYTRQAESSNSPFVDATRPTPKEIKLTQPNTEYNTSSYFVPDYVFPLDKEHPGYDDDNAQTSFQVNVSRPGRASFGENPNCPQCHPAYLKPGSCEPCIVKR